MRVSKTVVAVLLFSGCAIAGEALGGELAPGRYKRIACKGNASWTYDLFIPAAYAAEPKRKFPVLLTSGPGGYPRFMKMEDWAERRGVIIVAINNTKNKMEWEEVDPVQADVIASVEATVRVHPCLRFSMGMSGGACCSMHLAGKRNDKHAGILMLGHSGNGQDRHLEKHISVAFVHGENDKVHSPGAVRSVAKALESRGNPVRRISGDWGHEWGPHEFHVQCLDWMLDLQRLVHPKLPPEEKRAGAEELVRRAEGLAKIQGPAERLREADMLLELPEALTRKNSKDIYSGWFSASFELAKAKDDTVAKHAALTDLSENARIARCASTDRRELSKLLRELRRKSPAKEEWAARRLLSRIEFMEKKAGKSRSKKRQAAQSYAMIAKKYPDTAAGRAAGEAAKRLAADLSEGR